MSFGLPVLVAMIAFPVQIAWNCGSLERHLREYHEARRPARQLAQRAIRKTAQRVRNLTNSL